MNLLHSGNGSDGVLNANCSLSRSCANNSSPDQTFEHQILLELIIVPKEIMQSGTATDTAMLLQLPASVITLFAALARAVATEDRGCGFLERRLLVFVSRDRPEMI